MSVNTFPLIHTNMSKGVQWVQHPSVLWSNLEHDPWKSEASADLGCQTLTCQILSPLPCTFSLWMHKLGPIEVCLFLTAMENTNNYRCSFLSQSRSVGSVGVEKQEGRKQQVMSLHPLASCSPYSYYHLFQLLQDNLKTDNRP